MNTTQPSLPAESAFQSEPTSEDRANSATMVLFSFCFFCCFPGYNLEKQQRPPLCGHVRLQHEHKRSRAPFFLRDAQQHASRKRTLMSGKSRSISEVLLSVGLFLALQIKQDLDEWAMPRCLGVSADVCVCAECGGNMSTFEVCLCLNV